MDSNTGTRRSGRRRAAPPEFNNFEMGRGTRNTGSRINAVTQSQSQSQSHSQNHRRRGSGTDGRASQRRRLENNYSEMSAEEEDEPSSGTTSIRASARTNTQGVGLRNDAVYRRSYREQPQGPRQEGANIIAQGLRICYCDRNVQPSDCKECIPGVSNCEMHETVKCDDLNCTFQCHLGCIRSMKGQPNMTTFRCLDHEQEIPHVHLPYNTRGDGLQSVARNTLRMGIENDLTLNFRTVKRHCANVVKTLEECNVPEEKIEALKNHDPLPYPEIVGMDESKKLEHAKYGRRFEVSMLQFKTGICACCGWTAPAHQDSMFLGKNAPGTPLSRHHLKDMLKDAWECNCLGFCKGQQFYGQMRTTEIAVFRSHHKDDNGIPMIPEEGEGLQTKVKLCSICYQENKSVASDPNHMERSLGIGRMFSVRNGFGGGKIPLQPPATALDEEIRRKLTLGQELKHELHTCTAVEEAAVRQIAVLQNIVALKEGNLSTKGNTFMVWQRSMLHLILPNLPSECHYIVIRRNQATARENRMKQTKFKRQKIQRILELLVQTVEGVWKPTDSFGLTIDNQRLLQWPESGDITDVNISVQIFESDEEGNIVNDNDGRLQDGGDMGPSPLQNGEQELETYETTMNYTAVGAGNNDMVDVEMREAVERIAEQQQQRDATGGDRPTRIAAVFNQTDVLKTDGFVDMGKTPYSWARAFPSLFIPEFVYMPEEGNWKWIIRHDLTGWSNIREKKVEPLKWFEQEMWRYDAAPAAHPIFALALYNYKTSTALQAQGVYAVNTSDIDPNMTVESILASSGEGATAAVVKSLVNAAHCYSSSVAGSPRYWRATTFEFEAIHHFNSYILKQEATFFLTNSLADHHEYPLRLLLHNYVTSIRQHGRVPEGLEEILTNDSAFSKAAQTYKTVVTHYFSTKLELWYNIVLHNVTGLDVVALVSEFATGRGAIHGHSSGGSSSNNCTAEITMVLHELAWNLHLALEEVDRYIIATWPDEDIVKIKTQYVTGVDVRENILQRTAEGRGVWETFLATERRLLKAAGNEIGKNLETRWGHTALHHGAFPKDWVKPGGLESSGYRHSFDGMISAKDVLDRKELKMMKFEREDALRNRRVNICNHCGTHRCSGYCLKDKKLTVQFDPENEDHVVVARSTQNRELAEGHGVIKITEQECRMFNTNPIKYDPSGENNLTGSVQFCLEPELSFDKNSCPRFVARRNHPRILEQPHAAVYFGANNDIQHILINASFTQTMEKLGNNFDAYIGYYRNLLALRKGGLEHHSGSNTAIKYMTGYCCKGGSSTQAYNNMLNDVTNAYCERDENVDKTVRSIIAKHMSELMKGTSVTRDQAQYMLAGGALKRNTFGTIRKCSVNSVNVNDLVEDTASRSSFTWRNVLYHYIRRGPILTDVDLYTFCAKHWPSEEKWRPVLFYGFYSTATWPLDEKYAKWIVTIYCPWVVSVEQLLVPTVEGDLSTYAKYLMESIMTGKFQNHSVTLEIMRAKMNVKKVNISESNLPNSAAADTPTRNRNDERLQEAGENATQYGTGGADDGENDILGEDDLQKLPDPPPGINWTRSRIEGIEYDIEHGKTWLVNEKELFYMNRNEAVTNMDIEEDLQLFEENIYRPENAHEGKQRYVVALLLYQLHAFRTFDLTRRMTSGRMETVPYTEEEVNRRGEEVLLDLPPCINQYVEGRPGAGKTFVLLTCRNIVRKFFNNNMAEMSSAPTGCSSALIFTSTSCRSHKIPTDEKTWNKAPSDLNIRSCQNWNALRLQHCMMFLLALDEHSMTGRKTFGWLSHRQNEFRKTQRVYDEGGTMLHENALVLDQLVTRPMGGIPFVMTMGDTAQLPPVKDKPIYDRGRSTSGSNSADAWGRLAFQEFFNPTSDDVISSVVVMDQVVRQRNVPFKQFLERMTDGKLEESDVQWIDSRMLVNLAEDEKSNFDQALHLVVTWKEAKPIVLEYLTTLHRDTQEPIAKLKPTFESTRNDGKNCCVKKCSYPLYHAFCIGAKVMLLTNFIVEQWKLLNGSVGVVKDIIYEQSEGPRDTAALPAFVVVYFPEADVPENRKFHQALHRNCVAIPVVHEKCENCKRCSMKTIPLRICVALTVYKSQGMTIGELNPVFQYLIVHLPDGTVKNLVGQFLVACSRVTGPDRLAFANRENLSKQGIFKIGNTPSDERRRAFMLELRAKESVTMDLCKGLIAALDNHDEKTYEGGWDYLLNWYRETTNADTN